MFKIAQTAIFGGHSLQIEGPHERRPTWTGSSDVRTLSTTVAFLSA
jgi:hypothetical protein